MPADTAARLSAKHARWRSAPAPYTPPKPEQIVVRTPAVAVNSLAWIIQVEGSLTYRWLRYPAVLSSDVAGEVVEVGEGVTRMCAEDRVLGHAVGTGKDAYITAKGAFQEHTAVLDRLAAPIPDSLAYEAAAVLPLGCSTAACALFQAGHLGLRPSAGGAPTGKTVLVRDGSTSVGSNAVRLAGAAGYEVFGPRAARLRNVGSLGAAGVFDYRAPQVVGTSSLRARAAPWPVPSPSAPRRLRRA